MIETIVIVILILLLLGAIPRWDYNQHWGYGPFGGLVTLLIVLVILRLLGII